MSAPTVQLVGMFDSPYVRRVALSLAQLEVPFEHLAWSVGKDQMRIRELNPLGRVPVVVLPAGANSSSPVTNGWRRPAQRNSPCPAITT